MRESDGRAEAGPVSGTCARVPYDRSTARQKTADARSRHDTWIREHVTDLPEVGDRTWNP